MQRPPKLTDIQKQKLSDLEPRLKRAVKRGDLNEAKKVAHALQQLLRPTGHHVRLFRNKNLLYEAALESGDLTLAIQGFEGIRHAMSENTRTYLEATSLLAICYLRRGAIDMAEPLMAEVLKNETAIKSDFQRREFRKRIIRRFDEETVLASLIDKGVDELNPNEIENEAGKLIISKNEDEMFQNIGEATPQATVERLLRIEEYAQKQLPPAELRFLPSPKEKAKQGEVGKIVFSSFKRTLWRSLCDPESDIYKAWFQQGMTIVLDKKFIGSAVAATLSGFNIGIKAIAISTTALIIKFGIEMFCDIYEPEGIMAAREKRAKP